ncbi:hypothetical protein V6N13_108112 [Hibiscus sabdariffa]
MYYQELAVSVGPITNSVYVERKEGIRQWHGFYENAVSLAITLSLILISNVVKDGLIVQSGKIRGVDS